MMNITDKTNENKINYREQTSDGRELPEMATGDRISDDYFEIQDGILIRYHGPGGSVVIPEGVWKIGYLAFACRLDITSVTISKSVTVIGNYAFSRCLNLSSVTILSDQLTTIGREAFYCCRSLTSFWIPSGVTKIGRFSFSGSGLVSVSVPDSILDLGKGAFEYCDRLCEAELPGNITTITKRLFFGCKSLKKLTFSNEEHNKNECYGIELCGTEQHDSTNKYDSTQNGKEHYKTEPYETEHESENDHYQIVFPPTLKHIDEGAFCHCPFESVQLRDNITVHESSFFWDVKSIILFSEGLQFQLTNGMGLNMRSLEKYSGFLRKVMKKGSSFRYLSRVEKDLLLEIYNEQVIPEKIRDYISQNISGIVFDRILKDDLVMVKKLLSDGYVTKDRIDHLIEVANKLENREAYAILFDYKRERFGFSEPEEEFSL